MTGQTLLNYMELVNQELQLQSTEADVTRGLLALNVAQDLFENLAAQAPNILGSSTGTVTTTNGIEYTAWPSGLLRLDALDYLDPSSLLPAWQVVRIHGVGMHAYFNIDWNLVTSVTSGGQPAGYWTNGTRIYWAPLPNGVYTIRYYGLVAASDITASGTFAYPDAVAFPLAVLAARILKVGVDDQANDLAGIAEETVGAVIKTLSNFNRDGARPLTYTHTHFA